MGYLAHAHAGAKPGLAGSQNAWVDTLPVVNVTNAGRSIPVKFGLGGDRGLNIFASGSRSRALLSRS
jgi:hypothetical protein